MGEKELEIRIQDLESQLATALAIAEDLKYRSEKWRDAAKSAFTRVNNQKATLIRWQEENEKWRKMAFDENILRQAAVIQVERLNAKMKKDPSSP